MEDVQVNFLIMRLSAPTRSTLLLRALSASIISRAVEEFDAFPIVGAARYGCRGGKSQCGPGER